MYSQNNEETHIVNHLTHTNPRRFLDIGAYDGKTFSNTLKLVELGWSGVCVEPSPSIFPSLSKLHANNPLIKLMNVAVGSENTMCIFYDSGGDAISTSDLNHKRKWEINAGCKFKQIAVEMVTIDKILDENGYDFTFINIDVEGCNYGLFSMIPFNLLPDLKLLCIEHDSRDKEIVVQTSHYGFKTIHRNGENIILGR